MHPPLYCLGSLLPWCQGAGPHWLTCVWGTSHQRARGNARGARTALASPAVGCSHSPAKPRAGVLGRLVALQLFAGGSDAEPCWARSHAADLSIPCALLTGNLIYAIIKVKNRAFQHGSHFACTLQWVSANSAAVVCSAWNPGEWLLSRGISSDLIAKL